MFLVSLCYRNLVKKPSYEGMIDYRSHTHNLCADAKLKPAKHPGLYGTRNGNGNGNEFV